MLLNKEIKPNLKPFNGKQTNDWYKIEFLVLDWNGWNHLAMCKQMSSDSLKCYKRTMNLQIIYI